MVFLMILLVILLKMLLVTILIRLISRLLFRQYMKIQVRDDGEAGHAIVYVTHVLPPHSHMC